MKFAILGSGSSGNAAVVATAGSAILIDCGLSARSLERRLGVIGLSARDLDAVLVTHEHADHIGGVRALVRRFGMCAYMTHGTRVAAALGAADIPRLEIFSPHTPFRIGDLNILPTPVPHDAREPCQFVFEHAGRRLGVLTDLGSSTAHITDHYAGCDALVLEFNHALELLRDSAYPASVKQRIAGPLGHLSNQQSAALFAQVADSRLQHLVVAHVSRRTNTTERVRQTLDRLATGPDVLSAIASQDAVLPWCSIL